jgi:hypothetical protein
MAGINPSTEQQYRRITPTSNVEADFVYFSPNFEASDAGRTYVYDPTVIHPTCPSYIDHCFNNPSFIYTKERLRKNNKYLIGCQQAGRIFKPLIFSTYGAVSSEITDLISSLTEAFNSKLSWPPSIASQFISTSINICQLRGTASLLYNRYNKIVVPRLLAISSSQALEVLPPPQSIPDVEDFEFVDSLIR